jgi:hypothetical protein
MVTATITAATMPRIRKGSVPFGGGVGCAGRVGSKVGCCVGEGEGVGVVVGVGFWVESDVGFGVVVGVGVGVGVGRCWINAWR